MRHLQGCLCFVFIWLYELAGVADTYSIHGEVLRGSLEHFEGFIQAHTKIDQVDQGVTPLKLDVMIRQESLERFFGCLLTMKATSVTDRLITSEQSFR